MTKTKRAVQASAEIGTGANILEKGFDEARRLWNHTWWCAIGYNRRLRRQRGDIFQSMKGRHPKYPGKYAMQKALRDYPAYRGLSDRCSSYTVKNFDIAMRSWFANLKTNPNARPPRPIREGQTLTFEVGRNAKHLGDWRFRLTVLGGHIADRYCYIKIHVRPGVKVRDIHLIHIKAETTRRGHHLTSLIRDVELPDEAPGNHIAAIDLGIRNIAVTAFDTGEIILYDGGALLDVQRHANKQAAKCKPSGWAPGKSRLPRSKKQRRYLNKARNIMDLAIHNLTTNIIRESVKRGVRILAVGDLTDIRQDKDFGKRVNQQLHRWPFRKIIQQLKYKGEEQGIEVISISEEYTSQTCCRCGVVKKSNRISRGLYCCSNCGLTINADCNGAINMLQKVSSEVNPTFEVEAIFPGLPSLPEQAGRIGQATLANQPMFVAKFDLRNWSVVITQQVGEADMCEHNI